MIFPLALPEDDLAVPFEELVNLTHASLLRDFAPAELPLKHDFTPGPEGSGGHRYIREIFMPAGSCVLSELHITRHPYNVSRGCFSVRTKDGLELITAPHTGITEPGTQRILYIHEDTVFTTYHLVPDTMTDPEEIKASIVAPRPHNPHLELPQ